MNASWLDSCFLARNPRRKSPPRFSNTRILDLGPVAIRYKLTGQGAPVVLIPDPPNTIEHHDSLIRKLAREYRVLCFDPPGFGFSFLNPGFGFTLEEQTGALIAVLDRLGMHGCTLSISCLGAVAGLLAASRRPDLIANLLLLQVASFEELRLWSLSFTVSLMSVG